jgi:predicted DNA-binding ArsR family transcriptional regulator
MKKLMNSPKTEIDLDENNCVRAIIIEKYKILYTSIPKCGSSTVKDYLHYITTNKIVGTKSHIHLNPYTKLISFDSLKNEYKNYFKFSVVRDPKSRLRSYYSKNISEGGSLRKGLVAKSSNLNIKPSYAEILKNFQAYRNESIDFRHHTNPITRFLGDIPDRHNFIVDLNQLGDLIFKLENLVGFKLPKIHNMKAENVNLFHTIDDALEKKILDDFYRDDYEIYLKYFSSPIISPN